MAMFPRRVINKTFKVHQLVEIMIVKNERELLENAKNSKLREARKILIELADHVCKSVDPSIAIRDHIRVEGGLLKIRRSKFKLEEIGDIVVIGGGKASGTMAVSLEEILGDRITKGIVNVPDDIVSSYPTQKIELVRAGHPLPTRAGEKGAERMLAAASDLGPQDMVICLISGGGSALISLPDEGITLGGIRETTDLLVKSGANIQEINTVRKHLSRIKGGKLAKAAYPARVISLIISDVVGNQLNTIASGPTAPDPTFFTDALKVLKKYHLSKRVRREILNRLRKGAERGLPETPKPRDSCFKNVYNTIIASNADALGAASKFGKDRGLDVQILTGKMQGEARKVGKHLASFAKKYKTGKPVSKPILLLQGGETTVTVTGSGKGGRNQELALSASIEFSGLENVTIASFATDGIDGPTDGAGAIADCFTVKRAEQLGLDPRSYLDCNDSYHFFEELKDLIKTGVTGTNVSDIVALVIL